MGNPKMQGLLQYIRGKICCEMQNKGANQDTSQ